MASAALRLFRWQARSVLRPELGAAATTVVIELAQKKYAPSPPLARTSSGRFNLQMDALAIAVHPRSKLPRARWRERVSRRVPFKSPDWTMNEVGASGVYGFDVRRCAMADFLRGRGEGEFCNDVVCRQDLLMAQGRGEHLERAHTIATGDDRCDFRYTRSA